MRIVINGKEITHPVAKFAIGLVALFLSVIIAAVILFVVMPLIGVTIVIAVVFVGIMISSFILLLLFYRHSIRWFFSRSNKTVKIIDSRSLKIEK